MSVANSRIKVDNLRNPDQLKGQVKTILSSRSVIALDAKKVKEEAKKFLDGVKTAVNDTQGDFIGLYGKALDQNGKETGDVKVLTPNDLGKLLNNDNEIFTNYARAFQAKTLESILNLTLADELIRLKGLKDDDAESDEVKERIENGIANSVAAFQSLFLLGGAEASIMGMAHVDYDNGVFTASIITPKDKDNSNKVLNFHYFGASHSFLMAQSKDKFATKMQALDAKVDGALTTSWGGGKSKGDASKGDAQASAKAGTTGGNAQAATNAEPAPDPRIANPQPLTQESMQKAMEKRFAQVGASPVLKAPVKKTKPPVTTLPTSAEQKAAKEKYEKEVQDKIDAQKREAQEAAQKKALEQAQSAQGPKA